LSTFKITIHFILRSKKKNWNGDATVATAAVAAVAVVAVVAAVAPTVEAESLLVVKKSRTATCLINA